MSLEAGSIILWGSTTIPEGWVICDGNNGTPNLINRFVKGATDNTDLLETGGNTTHVHANSSSGTNSTHTHTGISWTTGTSDNDKYYGYSSGTEAYAAESHNHGTVSRTPNSAAGHSHTIGNTESGSSMPLYKQLIFIMKT